MEKYKTWEEYYESKQESYLDSENPADCKIQRRVGDYNIYATEIGLNTYHASFEIADDCQTAAIFSDLSRDDLAELVLRAYLGMELDVGTDDARDYLTINRGTDGKEYAWYFDGKTNVCCDCDEFFVCTDEDCDEIFGVEEEL